LKIKKDANEWANDGGDGAHDGGGRDGRGDGDDGVLRSLQRREHH